MHGPRTVDPYLAHVFCLGKLGGSIWAQGATSWVDADPPSSPAWTPLSLIPRKINSSKIEVLESPPSKSLLALSQESLHSLADAFLSATSTLLLLPRWCHFYNLILTTQQSWANSSPPFRNVCWHCTPRPGLSSPALPELVT